jgi:glycine/D-amino acid oxidase-like deaminating enzyme
MSTPRPIVVIGAGVIGLTTAITLLERGHGPVHVLASHLPSDPLDARYASSIAGAHHLSFADDNDERQSRWDWRSKDPRRMWQC